MIRRWLIALTTALVTSIAVSIVGFHHALRSHLAWCDRHHLICTWDGDIAPDPAWWSTEARLERLAAALRANERPRPWGGLPEPRAVPVPAILSAADPLVTPFTVWYVPHLCVEPSPSRPTFRSIPPATLPRETASS